MRQQRSEAIIFLNPHIFGANITQRTYGHDQYLTLAPEQIPQVDLFITANFSFLLSLLRRRLRKPLSTSIEIQTTPARKTEQKKTRQGTIIFTYNFSKSN